MSAAGCVTPFRTSVPLPLENIGKPVLQPWIGCPGAYKDGQHTRVTKPVNVNPGPETEKLPVETEMKPEVASRNTSAFAHGARIIARTISKGIGKSLFISRNLSIFSFHLGC
jgi:hypothetical protein